MGEPETPETQTSATSQRQTTDQPRPGHSSAANPVTRMSSWIGERVSIRWAIFAGLIVVMILGTVVAFQVNGGATAATSSGGASTLQGTDLGGTPAPNFTLTDQNGAAVTLSALRGHPIALTFLDSVCPHADCPLMAQYITASAHAMSSQERAQVIWLAISLDPWHDTTTTAKTFLSSHQVTIPMRFLLGSLPQLAPVWNAYHMESLLNAQGIVIHTTGLYILDQQGRERAFLDEGFDPHMLTNDLHLLLTQRIPVNSAAAQTAGFTVLTQSVPGGTFSVTVAAIQGNDYSFSLWVWDGQQQPLQNAQVTFTLTMPTMTMAPVRLMLQPHPEIGAGVYKAEGALSMKGHWQLVVAALPHGATTPIDVTFTFAVA